MRNTTSGPPSGGDNYLPKIALVDMAFKPKASVEFTIFGFMLIYYIPPIILYFMNRNHILIKYRQPINVVIAGIMCAFSGLCLPLIRYFNINCFINTWVVNPFIFIFVITTYSRYIKTYYIQQLSIFKLKFSEKKNRRMNDRAKHESVSNNISTYKIRDTRSAIHSYSLNKDSTVSNETNIESIGMVDPVNYFKKLNSIINKKISIYVVFIPVFFIIFYSIIMTIKMWDKMTIPCVNELREVSMPRIIGNFAIILSSIFFFYQAYYNQKWDIEIRVEYTVFIVSLVVCVTVMQLIINDVFGERIMKYRAYTFQIFGFVVFWFSIILPLIKILIFKFKNDDEKLSEEEFLARLSNAAFKAQVREIAINTFCVENLLFFEAHCDLMNIIIFVHN